MQAQELRIPNQWGIIHVVRTNCHTFDPLFQPHTSAKNSCFYQKNCHPKSCFFHTVQNFGNCSLKDPKSAGKKGNQCTVFLSFFMAFVTERPPVFCLACMQVFEGNVAASNTEAGKFCILETESCNLVNTFRCKFNRGDENKISVLQAQPTQLLWKNFIGGQGWYKHGRGYILQPSSVWFCTSWFSKQMPNVPEAVPAEAF